MRLNRCKKHLDRTALGAALDHQAKIVRMLEAAADVYGCYLSNRDDYEGLSAGSGMRSRAC